MSDQTTAQLNDLLDVLRAIRDGDFSRTLPSGGDGTVGEITETVNAIVGRLNEFAGELTRLCREYGTDGRLGGQIELQDPQESWLHLEQNVNFMAANLTDQVRNCVDITSRYAEGDLSRRADVSCSGEVRELTLAINRLGERLQIQGGTAG